MTEKRARGLLSIIGLTLILALPSLAAKPATSESEVDYGKLSIRSEIPGSDIYVNAKYLGQDKAFLSALPVGKHYLRVIKDGWTYQSGLVEVKGGEETTIIAKPTDDKLVANYKKQNMVHIYLSGSKLSHFGVKTGSEDAIADIAPFLGVNLEVIFPFWEIDTSLGFRYNVPAAMSIGGTKITELTISGPYANVSKKIIPFKYSNLSIGGGVNYSFYSGNYISISGITGYQAYLELASKEETQSTILRGGYLVNYGRGSNQYNFSNAGFFLTAGVAYRL